MIFKAGMKRRMIKMSDIAIKPAVSIDESGIVKMPEYDGRFKPGRLTMAYLVVIEAKKTDEYFVATKFDTLVSGCAKFVGFYYTGVLEDLYTKYEEIISSTPATNFVEMIFPWTRVKSVRSLVYRHKTTGERK
jgi:hypothetical protein